MNRYQRHTQNFLVDHELEMLAAENCVFHGETFVANGAGGCAYDLRAGRLLASKNRKQMFDLEKQEFILQPGEVVTLQTLEQVDFKNPLCVGLIVNKHTILAHGVVHPATSIDPGYSGPLVLTLMNLGNNGWRIRYGDRVAKLFVTPISPTPMRVYDGGRYAPGTLEYTLSDERHPNSIVGREELEQFIGSGPLGEIVKRVGKLEEQIGHHETVWALRRYRLVGGAVWALLLAVIGGLVGAAVAYWLG